VRFVVVDSLALAARQLDFAASCCAASRQELDAGEQEYSAHCLAIV